MKKGDFGDITFPNLLKVNDWTVAAPAAILIVLFLFGLRLEAFEIYEYPLFFRNLINH